MDGVFVDQPRPPVPEETPAAISSISQVWVSPTPRAAAIPTPPPPPPAAPPADSGDARLFPTDPAPGVAVPAAGTPARPPVAVWAVRCPQAHLNAPDAQSCRVCGTTVTDREPSIVHRPALGRLDFGPLGSVPLDGDLLIGREPGNPPPDGPRAVTIAHAALSRQHVEVQVRDWLVVVVDLDSNNGTTVTPPGRGSAPLRARDPVPIQPGTVVTLAQQVPFTYVAGA
jgi:hypothetical protein